MPFITQGKTNIKYILIVVILAAIAGGGILGYYYLWIKDIETRLTKLELSIPKIKNQTVEEKGTIYHIAVSKKHESSEPGYMFLKENLEELFGLASESISQIVFDTREEYPFSEKKLDFLFYIIVKERSHELINQYENEDFKAQVTKADEKLIPYIIDPDHCEIDEDCTIRTNFCTYGAFNYYYSFIDIWGCEGQYEGEFDCSDPNKEGYGTECFVGYDEELKCEKEVEYNGVSCVEGKCIAQNRVVNCIPK